MQSRSNMRYGTSQSWSYTSCGHEGSGEAEWRPSGKDTGVVHSGTQPWVQRMAAGRTAYRRTKGVATETMGCSVELARRATGAAGGEIDMRLSRKPRMDRTLPTTQ